MKNFLLLFILALGLSLSAQELSDKIITEDLVEYLNQNPDEELIKVNIRLKEKLVARNVIPRYATLDVNVRREAVVAAFKDASQRSQADLLSFLHLKSSQVSNIHSFWITNMVNCLASPEAIAELANRPDVDRIDIDQESYVLIGQEDAISAGNGPLAGEREITYNVTKMNVPDVWAMGYTGQGVVVAIIDTGVNYDHEDLQDHMWEDPDYPNHGWDFNGNDNDPKDDQGHGSHCAGTVAGDGTAGSQTGMAPDAKIMALKILNANGGGVESNGWKAIEFAVEHGADVLSMSIGWTPQANPDRKTWRNTHDNALAAGVIASVAAGNEGGSPNSTGNLRTPGDCPPPWLNPEQTLIGGISSVVCIGATNKNDGLAGFSSRGPAEWEYVSTYNDYPFNPEMGLLRPDVSAPGVDIKSVRHNSNTGYREMSGTSMSTPGVAGVMALLLSKNPDLTPEAISQILETTSKDLGAEGKDNEFGAGRVDALEAINATPFAGGIIYNSHTVNDENGNGNIEAGESILLSLEMYNESPQDYSNVNVTISSSSPYATVTDNDEAYGNFSGKEYKTVADGFAFDVATGTPGASTIEFDVVSNSGSDSWNSSFRVETYGPNLKFATLHVDDMTKGNGNGVLDPGETADLIIMVKNHGQVGQANIDVTVGVDNAMVTIDETKQSIDSISAGGMQKAVFQVSVDENMPLEQFLKFAFDLQSSPYSDNRSYTLGTSFVVEDWESGSFDTYNWKSGSFSKWNISNNNPFEGKFSAESVLHTNNWSSEFTLDCEIADEDSVSFYFEVSSEEGSDFLRFDIDGEKQGDWSGEIGWNRVAFPLAIGEHTLRWQYIKDGAGSEGFDNAKVDFITLPILVVPIVNAGEDASICDAQTYQLAATADNYTSLEWMTYGDGTFSDASILNPLYTPGMEDVENDSVTLMLKANGHSSNVANGLVLFFLNSPDKADTPEGDTQLCLDPGASLYSTGSSVNSTYQWVIEPSSAGITQSDADTALIAWDASFTGSATIKVREINSCGEGEFSDALNVVINDLPEVNLGDDQLLCGVEEYELDAGNPGATYLWSTGETTQTILASGSGNTSFWVNVTSPALCVAADTVSLNFVALPVVDLGADTAICNSSEIMLDAGNPGSTYLWSTGETTQTILVDAADYEFGEQDFACEVTNTDGCSATDDKVVDIKDCTGIDEIGAAIGLEVFPNPNKGVFQLKLDSPNKEKVRVRIMNISGVLVYESDEMTIQGSHTHQVSLDGLADGIYSVFVIGEGMLINKKIIVRR